MLLKVDKNCESWNVWLKVNLEKNDFKELGQNRDLECHKIKVWDTTITTSKVRDRVESSFYVIMPVGSNIQRSFMPFLIRNKNIRTKLHRPYGDDRINTHGAGNLKFWRDPPWQCESVVSCCVNLYAGRLA